MKKFIIVAGNIGAGKTTLANLIANIFEYKVYEERIDNNPYLSPFYRDMKTYAFKLQRFFLFTRVIDHEIVSNSKHSCVQDRSVYEDAEIFARNVYEQGHMTHEDYKRYRRIYDDLIKDLTKPDLLIYLRTSPEILRKRIAKRGRDYEQELIKNDNPYLEQLHKLYEDWMNRHKENVLVLETDDIDFVENPEHLNTVVKKIRKALGAEDAKLTEFIQN